MIDEAEEEAVAKESSTIELETDPELTAPLTTTSRTGGADWVRIRVRIRTLLRVPAKALLSNPKNWGRHLARAKVLDVTAVEADKLLLTLDPLAAMAESDAERIETLLQTVRTDDQATE